MHYNLLILIVILLHANINNACNENCERSDCCASNNPCDAQSNCYQTSGSRCSQNSCRTCFNTCNAGCRTRTCASRCTQNCCSNAQNCDDNSKIVSTTEKTGDVTIVHTPQPDRNAHIQHAQIENVNNGTIQTTLNLRNEVSIVNNITVPIVIQNDNKINVRIVEIRNDTSETTQYTTPTFTTPKSTDNNTIVDRIPVLIPIPSKPIYIPIPTPVVIPQPVRQPGCCLTFSPCLHNDVCSPYQQSCGQHCLYPYQYQPSNPCLQRECQKRQFVPQWSCHYGYCQSSITNCNRCDDDSFYRSFNDYRQCGGCYYR